jgi:hypothetical protein
MNKRARAFRLPTSLLGSMLGLALLAACADAGPSPSLRYDGVYDLTATPVPPSSSNTGCAPFTEDVAVEDGRLDFAARGADQWRGSVDAKGRFHGEISQHPRTFGLASGVDVPGFSANGAGNRCQWHYSLRYEGTDDEVPNDD